MIVPAIIVTLYVMIHFMCGIVVWKQYVKKQNIHLAKDALAVLIGTTVVWICIGIYSYFKHI